MRAQIYTDDIVNLETVTIDEENGSEVRTPTIVPNIEGEITLTAPALNTMVAGFASPLTDADCRLIVIASPDVVPVFHTEDMANYFDPIERVADIEAGNIGSILGLQVVRGLQGDHPYVAIVEVRDADTVEIVSFDAVEVKL